MIDIFTHVLFLLKFRTALHISLHTNQGQIKLRELSLDVKFLHLDYMIY